MKKAILTQSQINLLFNSFDDLQKYYSEFERGDLKEFKIKELKEFLKLIQYLKNNN